MIEAIVEQAKAPALSSRATDLLGGDATAHAHTRYTRSHRFDRTLRLELMMAWHHHHRPLVIS
ncbi:hypothetical protein [Sphingomonas sp. NPDC079357]|uniref:hypothetical protein n=1 Tax=Sphingomonas sp. NPDC079357 TaxID=3364518 RepID=UPI00385041C3